MASRPQFAPLCDLHHVSMDHKMLDVDSTEISSFYACRRPDCTRVFRDSIGYLDRVESEFDDSRASTQKCPRCESILYLSEVDHSQKIETWDCPHPDCDFSSERSSPSGR